MFLHGVRSLLVSPLLVQWVLEQELAGLVRLQQVLVLRELAGLELAAGRVLVGLRLAGLLVPELEAPRIVEVVVLLRPVLVLVLLAVVVERLAEQQALPLVSSRPLESLETLVLV